jgi:hypothetical protein
MFDKYEEGNSGFVIGGGSSLLGLKQRQINALLELVTIGANKAYKLFTPKYLVYSDRNFAVLYRRELEEVVCIKFTRDYLVDKNSQLSGSTYGLSTDVDRSGWGWVTQSFEDPFPFPNTGASALIIAYLLGCNPIYLLGIDLCTSLSGETHFHRDYHEKSAVLNSLNGQYNLMRNQFVSIIMQLERKSVDVYSCSPISALNTLIPYVALDFVLQRGANATIT